MAIALLLLYLNGIAISTLQTFEEKTIFVARRLAHQMKQSMTTVSGYLPINLQPAFVRERMEFAIKYTEDLYHTFTQVRIFHFYRDFTELFLVIELTEPFE